MRHDRFGTFVVVALLGASSVMCSSSEPGAAPIVETPDAAPVTDAGSGETPESDGGSEDGLLATVPSGVAVDFIALSGD